MKTQGLQLDCELLGEAKGEIEVLCRMRHFPVLKPVRVHLVGALDDYYQSVYVLVFCERPREAKGFRLFGKLLVLERLPLPLLLMPVRVLHLDPQSANRLELARIRLPNDPVLYGTSDPATHIRDLIAYVVTAFAYL